MITNIVDNRKRKYRFLKINAIVETQWHDNNVADADQWPCPSEGFYDGPNYAEREHITVAEAIEWALSFGSAVTLFIYDADGGIYPIKE